MNIYRISQDERGGYDTFDAAIVAAESEDAARRIHPSEDCYSPESCEWARKNYHWRDEGPNEKWTYAYSSWASRPDKVRAELLGTAVEGTPEGVLLASFNAG